MDWEAYFASLSDECLCRIGDFMHRERMKRDIRRFQESLPPLSQGEMILVNTGKVIDAIKVYRGRNRVGLREAKFAVDRYRGESVRSGASSY